MTTTNENELIAQMTEAHNAGRAWANGLKVGDKFTGTFPEANRLGYTSVRLRSVFTHAALDILWNKRVVTDMNGVLVEYSDLRTQEAK